MIVNRDNVRRLLTANHSSNVSLFAGALFAPDYIGFKDQDTIYMIAELRGDEADSILKNPKSFIPIVNKILQGVSQ